MTPVLQNEYDAIVRNHDIEATTIAQVKKYPYY